MWGLVASPRMMEASWACRTDQRIPGADGFASPADPGFA